VPIFRPFDNNVKVDQQLKQLLAVRPLVILGVGSELRSDDSWAHFLIRKLKSYCPADVYPIWCSTMPENFIKPACSFAPKAVLIVDSADMGLRPGNIRFMNDLQGVEDPPQTHRMPLDVMAGMIKDRSGAHVSYFFMQPKNIEFSSEMSDEVSRSAEKIAEFFKKTLWKKNT